MGTVSVPAEFFRGELRVYSNWREAFCRELLQNSTDAGASRIDVTFSTTPDGHARVTFSDDGHGMDRDVLENVFFALGRSTKTDATSIGGFGRARIIICFAQQAYTIRTRTLLVTGHGGQYTITDTAEDRRGCEFTIDLIDSDVDRVRREMRYLVESCSLTVPVYLDGYRVHGQTLPTRAARILRDHDGQAWAKVYVRPNGYGSLLVQVHGLVMFTRYVSVDATVAVELLPGRARDVLTASRDRLHQQFADQLDQFVTDLTTDRRAALRPADEPLDIRVGGGGFLATVGPVTAPSGRDDTGDGLPTADTPDPCHATESAERATISLTPATHQSAAYAAALAPTPRARAAEPSAERNGLGFDVYLYADAASPTVRRAVRAWDPTGWVGGRGARRRALLLTWKAAVAHVLDVLVAHHPQVGQVAWTVGWVFDEDTRALHRSVGDAHVIALNPLSGGQVAYRTTHRADRRRLLAVAAHEVCHVVHPVHDEPFAKLLTELLGAVDPSAADAVMRGATQR